MATVIIWPLPLAQDYPFFAPRRTSCAPVPSSTRWRSLPVAREPPSPAPPPCPRFRSGFREQEASGSDGIRTTSLSTIQTRPISTPIRWRGTDCFRPAIATRVQISRPLNWSTNSFTGFQFRSGTADGRVSARERTPTCRARRTILRSGSAPRPTWQHGRARSATIQP